MWCSLFRYSCSKIFVIPLLLLKKFHHSIIPLKKAHIIPLFQEQNFRYSYSIIPLQPPILLLSILLSADNTMDFMRRNEIFITLGTKTNGAVYFVFGIKLKDVF